MDFTVTMRFQFPAYDEKGGIPFDVAAPTKAKAIEIARRQAERDGHTGSGKGRYTFTAEQRV